MKTIKSIFKTILFILIFIFIFSYLSNLFCRKTLEGEWNHTQKISGFYNEPENEFDVMFFGSSNTYCSFNPLILYEKTGIKSYVFASQQQPVWATYAYMKEALKTQKPKLLVLDVLMFTKDTEFYDDGVNYSFMDDIPLSINKLELAAVSAPKGERLRLLVNFIKYHSRWSELTEEDYGFKRSETHDLLKGYVFLDNVFDDARPPAENITETAPLGDKEILYFNKIVKLAKDSGIPLLLVKTPSNAVCEDQKLFNSVERLAAENGVEFVNYNSEYADISLDLKEDFYDKSHLNYRGAVKFTSYFAGDMLNRFPFLEAFADSTADSNWNNSIDQYYGMVSNIEQS